MATAFCRLRLLKTASWASVSLPTSAAAPTRGARWTALLIGRTTSKSECVRCLYSSAPLRNPAVAAVEEAAEDVRIPILEQSSNTAAPAPTESHEGDVGSPGHHRLSFRGLSANISNKTLKAITNYPLKHTMMTPVQEQILPLLPDLINEPSASSTTPRDLLVRAKTGTGKTLAFLVPAIEKRARAVEAFGKEAQETSPKQDKHSRLRAELSYGKTRVGTLIISPTRELAGQIVSEAQKLTTHHDNFEVQLLVGGSGKGKQLSEWRKNRKDIVVATPGRLRDMLESEEMVKDAMQHTEILILDEADTLLDMGFRDDLEAITSFLPDKEKRQTFLFSATVSRAVEQIARKTLNKNHKYISTVDDSESPVHAHVPQFHTVLPSAAEQIPHVMRVLAHDQLLNAGKSKALVFLPTTRLTMLFATILRELSRKVLPAGSATAVYEIHSRLNQVQRTRASDLFRGDKSGAAVLVTSDVSARGVDYPNVSRVIQVGVPSTTDQYVHRVGRTGRSGGMVGRGDLVLLPWEQGFVQVGLQEVPLKPVTTKELKRQLDELVVEFDKDPQSFFKDITPTQHRRPGVHSHSRASPIVFTDPATPRLASLEEELQSLLTQLDENAIEETFSAMLGYYMGKTGALHTQRDAILQGCKDWSVQAAGLSKPPYVSEAFLKKVGYGDQRDRRGSRGPMQPGRPSPWARDEGRDSRRPWEQRGRQRDDFGSESSGGWRAPSSQPRFPRRDASLEDGEGGGFRFGRAPRQDFGARQDFGRGRDGEGRPEGRPPHHTFGDRSGSRFGSGNRGPPAFPAVGGHTKGGFGLSR